MVYTEFFVRGTQPGELCPLHASPSLLDRLAGVFGAGDDASPALQGDLKPPGSAVRTTGTASGATPSASPDPPPQVQKAEEPKKKRGFWSRLFGKGDDKKDPKKDEKKKPGGG
jgi:hypothetical protein